MCNQVFLIAHCYAFALENNISIFAPGFFRYEHYFPNLYNTKYTKRKIYSKFNYKIKTQIFKIFRILLHKDSKILRYCPNIFTSVTLDHLSESFFLDNDCIAEKRLSKNCVLFEGWLLRSFTLFGKYKNEIKHLFEPNVEIQKSNALFLSSLPQGRKNIGVHIRKGDYKEEAPQWDYHIEDYLKIIKNIDNSTNENLNFILVSNEKINISKGKNIFVRNGDEAEDLFTLSNCDYIIGPPSTYNRWAAFWGDSFHFTLENTSDDIHLDDFDKLKINQCEPNYNLTEKDMYLLNFFGII